MLKINDLKFDENGLIPAVVTDDEYSFTIPVEALDASIACASYSKNKDQWYARSILFRADSLPEGALKEKLGDNLDIMVVPVNPTAGSHCGPDAMGICFRAKHR